MHILHTGIQIILKSLNETFTSYLNTPVISCNTDYLMYLDKFSNFVKIPSYREDKTSKV